jgi:hypothetical protein
LVAAGAVDPRPTGTRERERGPPRFRAIGARRVRRRHFIRQDNQKHMSFRFTPSPARHSRRLEGATFEVRRLWRKHGGRDTDITHLIDRTYAYRSLRELRWHLAERFGLAPATLELREA